MTKPQSDCAPSEDSDQPGHPPRADAQADLSLRWAHSHFVGFVMSRLKFVSPDSFGNRARLFEYYLRR